MNNTHPTLDVAADAGRDEELFHDVVSRAPIGVYIVQDGVFQLVNPWFQHLTGYAEKDLLGVNPLTMVLPEDRELVRQCAVEMLKGNRSSPYEYRTRRKDGSVLWIMETVASLPYRGKRAAVGYFMDITFQKDLEEALRASSEHYRTVVENVNDAIAINAGAKRVFVNRAFLALHGLQRPSQVLGHPVDELIVPEDKQLVRQRTLARQRGEAVPGVYEYRIRRADGDVRTVQTSAAPIAHHGRPAALAVIRDVTERKQLEEQLAAQAEELRRSNRELEQFAHVASHDLQEPLRMVSSFVQLLARRYEGQLKGEGEEFIAYIVDGAKRMQTLINDLLSLSRVGTRGKPFEPTDTGAIVEGAIASLGVAIEEGRAVVEWENLPTVVGDGTQLGQLVQNLIGNAIKFRGDRRPHIRVSAERGDGQWLFSVQDNGIGIEPQYAERIFGIFQRLHTMAEYPGTGIGLAVCQRIVERHGGRIWVESAHGKGSTFRFTLPDHPLKEEAE